MKNRHNPNSRNFSALAQLLSMRADGNDITLCFSNPESMEAFKRAALNALLIEKQQAQQTDMNKTHSSCCYIIEEELRGQKPSRRAKILCRTALFWHFLEFTQGIAINALDEMEARQFINATCNIGSRRELDSSDEIANRYIKLIEDPFLIWLKYNKSFAA